MTNEKFAELFGGPARTSEAWMTKRERDLSRSIQVVTEEAILRTARYAHKLTGEKKLVMAGGVALNCVANGRLLREGPFEDIWIQPAAGDAGGAMGAALDAYHTYFEKPRTMPADKRPRQGGSYWGPAYSDAEIEAFVKTHGYAHRRLADSERADTVARILAEGKVVGHFAGRVEFGPRSLGARAILGDARNEEMQVNLNLKIKYRESFRPFAPSVLAERVSDYFELDRESPYMLLVAPVKESRRLPMPPMTGDDLTAIVRQPRSDLPAITHVDYSARVQTVMRTDHPVYYDVIKKFEEQTGCGVIVNTSFNVRGEPIVCTPDDAYRCFMRTNMDVLVLGNYLLRKEEQPAWPEPKGHVEEDDDPKAKPAVEAAFADALSKAFFDDFLPVVSGLGKKDVLVQTQFKKAPSMWVDVEEAQGRAVFAIPPALDSAVPDPERMADAITSFWSRGPAAERLRPVVVKLLQIGQEFAQEEERAPDEQVSHAMYVMY